PRRRVTRVTECRPLDSRLRGNDGEVVIPVPSTDMLAPSTVMPAKAGNQSNGVPPSGFPPTRE
ncbi:MAG: hypothetical protein ABW168_21750, partial [Sedimenticola sp.]